MTGSGDVVSKFLMHAQRSPEIGGDLLKIGSDYGANPKLYHRPIACGTVRGLPLVQRTWFSRIGVVLGYACLALAFSWPLPLHIGTALTGDPGGDTGAYIWNQWVFRYELTHGQSPFRTSRILSLNDTADLSQHNYTVFLDLLALPLQPLVGAVAAFNVVFLVACVLTALCTYALARSVTKATRAEAWLAGAAFAWSPVLMARSTGHFSLVAAAPLPLFVLALVRAARSQRSRDAALAGICMAWAGFCDAYYAVYCLLIAAAFVVSHVATLTVARRSTPAAVRWALNVSILCVCGLVVGLLAGSGGRFALLGVPVSVHGLYTPMFVLTVLVAVRCLLDIRLHAAVQLFGGWKPVMRLVTIGVLACAGPLSPVLFGIARRVADGRFANPSLPWRSSPRGVDLLALFEANPNNPVVRWFGDQQLANGEAFLEFTAALSLVTLVVAGIAVLRANYRPRRRWIALTAGFALLALGPFVYVAGFNTHVPGPWALLRYLPVIGIARSPARFAVVAALGMAILFAGALVALRERYPQQRRIVLTVIALLLLFELNPAPRTLYSASVPDFYAAIAADPRSVRVLHLPFGVRDGTFSAGNFTPRVLFFQTAHGKPLIGGYLSRISPQRVRQLRAQPTLDALMTMSEGNNVDAGACRVHSWPRSGVHPPLQRRLRRHRPGANVAVSRNVRDRGLAAAEGRERRRLHTLPAFITARMTRLMPRAPPMTIAPATFTGTGCALQPLRPRTARHRSRIPMETRRAHVMSWVRRRRVCFAALPPGRRWP